MSIKININPALHAYTNGKNVVKVNGSTVGQCLEELVTLFPSIREGLFYKDGKLLNNVEVFVNGHSAYPDELAKLVKEGDEIHIVVMIGGG